MSHRAHNGKLMACDLLALADERPAPVATRVGFGEWGLGSSQVRARVDPKPGLAPTLVLTLTLTVTLTLTLLTLTHPHSPSP